ncbi:OB-fold nucleic acid binding domain-containing protein [Micromonospora arida]|uniref:OB-fold nucleic acid binding domain-containing protein n=1 Tax=Micromonospora arida TaxID=2203715 RepID=UPI0033A6B817
MPEEEDSRSGTTILYARDVESHLRLLPEAAPDVRLTGLLTRVRLHGGVAFLDFRDVTGAIQVVAERRLFPAEAWGLIKGLITPTRVSVSGWAGRTRNGRVAVFVREVPAALGSSLEQPLSQAAPDYAQTGMQMFLARLRNKASEFFRSVGYLEIEPKLISATWPSPGLEPLRVQYQGFGFPAFLAPSPSSQLLDALIATGAKRVFAVSRCFTTTFRDEKSSAESLILSAKEVGEPEGNQYDTIRRAVLHVFGDFQTLPEGYYQAADDWHSRTLDWGGPSLHEPVATPTFETYLNPAGTLSAPSSTQISRLFRLVWPKRRVIAEGCRERLEVGLPVTSTTLHLERMVSLLRDVPVRHIGHLGRSSNEQ